MQPTLCTNSQDSNIAIHVHEWLHKTNTLNIPYTWITWVLGFSVLDRGRAKIAISPLAKAATAATAIDGEFPPPNS